MCATRSAESTIKGFLYQFHKTAAEIISADEADVLTVEGIIEDIDIQSADDATIAIQCKYHESASSYTPSIIYKPLLQMAVHDSNNHGTKCRYRIFIHIPNQAQQVRQITDAELAGARQSTDSKLTKIIEKIGAGFDVDSFRSRTEIEFGPSLLSLESELKTKLAELAIPNADVDTILYPNAINFVSRLATGSTPSDRETSRTRFKHFLASTHETAISRWTLALRDRKKVLDAKRAQLRQHLSQNTRKRYLYFEPKQLHDFEDGIIIFIKNFLAKYHCKVAHTKTPLIAIDGDTRDIEIHQRRLFKKDIRAHTGLIGGVFEVGELFRPPMRKTIGSRLIQREFDLRLLACAEHRAVLNEKKCDDIYFVTEEIPSDIDIMDVNATVLGVSTFSELEYVLSMRDSYE
jgi:hypothetical protein